METKHRGKLSSVGCHAGSQCPFPPPSMLFPVVKREVWDLDFASDHTEWGWEGSREAQATHPGALAADTGLAVTHFSGNKNLSLGLWVVFM